MIGLPNNEKNDFLAPLLDAAHPHRRSGGQCGVRVARVRPAFELAGGQHGSHLAAQRGAPTLTAYVIVEGERLGASSSILIFLTGRWWVQKQQRKWMSAAGRWKAGRWDQAASDLSDGRTVALPFIKRKSFWYELILRTPFCLFSLLLAAGVV